MLSFTNNKFDSASSQEKLDQYPKDVDYQAEYIYIVVFWVLFPAHSNLVQISQAVQSSSSQSFWCLDDFVISAYLISLHVSYLKTLFKAF